MYGIGKTRMTTSQLLLITCGSINAAIAMLHAVIIYYGPPAYRYFGAGEKMATMAEQGSLLPAAVTFGITLVFSVFAAFAFAEAGLFSLPFSFAAVISIAAVYTLRGLMVLPLLVKQGAISRFDLFSSIISLVIGLLHFAGLYRPLHES